MPSLNEIKTVKDLLTVFNALTPEEQAQVTVEVSVNEATKQCYLTLDDGPFSEPVDFEVESFWYGE